MQLLSFHLPKWHTMMHWGLDVHAVDRDNSSVLQLHCHVLQRGQGERHRACAHSILIVCALKHSISSRNTEDDKQLVAAKWRRKTNAKNAWLLKHNIYYLYVLNNDRKLAICAVSRQQILTVASEGEELVVKGLEVGLTHHQALTYIQTAQT